MKLLFICALLLPWPLAGTRGAEAAAGPVQWYKTAQSLESSDLYDVAVNSRSTYVAVGQEGTILTSADARTWQATHTQGTESYHSVATSGAGFVAAGNKGALKVSKDGYSWTNGKLNRAYTLSELVPAEDRKLENKDYTINWTSTLPLTALAVDSVIYDGKKYVAVGNWSVSTGTRKAGSKSTEPSATLRERVIMTSPDGNTWSLRLAEVSLGKKIIYDGAKYLIMADRTLYQSADLNTWKEIVPAAVRKHSGAGLDDIIYANGTYTAIGWDGNISLYTGRIYTSKDGVNWTEIMNNKELGYTVSAEIQAQYGKSPGFAGLAMNSIMWDGKQYWIAGYRGLVLRSDDGRQWERWSDSTEFLQPLGNQNSAGKKANINKIMFDGKRYIEVGNRGTVIVSDTMKNADVVRKRLGIDVDILVHDGNSRYLAAGSEGDLLESPDGYNWTSVAMGYDGIAYTWEGAAAGKGTVLLLAAQKTGSVFSGEHDYFYSSSPGVWEKKKFPVKADIAYGISYQAGKFYVNTYDGYMTSTDGLTWSKLTAYKPRLTKIISNGKIMIGLAANGETPSGAKEQISWHQVYTSADGVTWKKAVIEEGNVKYRFTAEDILWDGKQFSLVAGYAYSTNVTPGKSKEIFAASVNGIQWKLTGSRNEYMSSVASDGKQFVAKGPKGLYLSSDGVNFKLTGNASVSGKGTNVVLWDGEKFIAGGQGGLILVSKKPPAAGGQSWQDEVTTFAIQYDPEHPIDEKASPAQAAVQQAAQQAAEAFKKEAAVRIDAVKEVGRQFGFDVSDEERKDGWYCFLMHTEDIDYATFPSGDFRNQLEIQVYFNGIDTKQMKAASQIIARHTGASADEMNVLLQSVLDGKQDVTQTTSAGGTALKVSLVLKQKSTDESPEMYGELTIQY
ncbi:hypothetical protein [Paenibacillus sp. MMS20-IR301]|uniref:hypothetical protein n=1 Tax=Paenibacillus sp. MMS20-IR301 TaxID=2895946 RepID=UPI0028E5FD14|nr:hypothetical protein [Paenibacillus sp. MMS20-IR301]WNS44302.1 hypothetical protein LOS79_03250 [Paenibacillus sp. MMS20-IR301]